MTKLTLDMATFKALASDTRLDILKALDGKRMSLRDISNATSLNKATLHEHLIKLNEAGLVKKNEREGHKWVYYKLTWKGECLLHPENTRIVVLFCATFVTLFIGIIQLVNYVKGIVIGKIANIGQNNMLLVESSPDHISSSNDFYNVNLSYGEGLTQSAVDKLGVRGTYGNSPMVSEVTEKVSGSSSQLLIWHDPSFQIIAFICFVICGVLLFVGLWWFFKSKKPKL